MPKLIDINKSVNANDNPIYHWLETIDDNEKLAYIEIIPWANYIIQKHGKDWWRNLPNSPEFQSAQLGISLCLFDAHILTDDLFQYVAVDLGINPILLMNDPELLHLKKA